MEKEPVIPDSTEYYLDNRGWLLLGHAILIPYVLLVLFAYGPSWITFLFAGWMIIYVLMMVIFDIGMRADANKHKMKVS